MKIGMGTYGRGKMRKGLKIQAMGPTFTKREYS